jgi:hypothetical protein
MVDEPSCQLVNKSSSLAGFSSSPTGTISGIGQRSMHMKWLSESGLCQPVDREFWNSD